MNFLMGLVLTVLFWVLFSSLQEAKDSDKPNGCCENNTCGKSQFDILANLDAGLISIASPIAKALIGKEEGTSVTVSTPGGTKHYEILSIEIISS